ncbi:hypothetical protein Desgi_1836 [Desulfoscipio gibsoniae DSM 7213]|uniref:Uncharacterized protein n=1 Tax=Desulfoscipio gibsoniae DSM 7213 TaxID=767817 RepID=R4KFB3_9FIRM|nr:hypothetical protein Desgi_1836 [Desulfoscipio gibsoniae DSM 7213]
MVEYLFVSTFLLTVKFLIVMQHAKNKIKDGLYGYLLGISFCFCYIDIFS